MGRNNRKKKSSLSNKNSRLNACTMGNVGSISRPQIDAIEWDKHEDIESEQVMFRHDSAWNKSTKITERQRIKTPVKTQSETHPIIRNVGSFESELEKTCLWMKDQGTRGVPIKISEKIITFNVSERSKDFEAFFPCVTPCFLGDVICDADLDIVLQELEHDLAQDVLQDINQDVRQDINQDVLQDDLQDITQDDDLTSLQSSIGTCATELKCLKKSKKKKSKSNQRKKEARMHQSSSEITLISESVSHICSYEDDLVAEFWTVLNPALPLRFFFNFFDHLFTENLQIVSYFRSETTLKWTNNSCKVDSPAESSLIIQLKSKNDQKQQSMKKLQEEFSEVIKKALDFHQLGHNIDIKEEYIQIMTEKPDAVGIKKLWEYFRFIFTISEETGVRLRSLLYTTLTSTVIQCITFRVKYSHPIFQKMFETLGKCGDIYGIYFHESLSLELAKDLTLFSVEDMEWGSSIHELQNADNGFISFLGVLDRKTLQELQVLVDEIHTTCSSVSEILLPISPIQNFRHIKAIFPEKDILQLLEKMEPIIEYASTVVFVLHCTMFVNLGHILCLAKEYGFYLMGMQSVRLTKQSLIDMISVSAENKQPSRMYSHIQKRFCNGPSITLCLNQSTAREKWCTVLEKSFGAYKNRLSLETEGILCPRDNYTSHQWSTILFPGGPVLDIKYTPIGSTVSAIEFPRYFDFAHCTDPHHVSHRNYGIFPVIFLSISNSVEENLESWGKILSKILQLNFGNIQIRIESCNLINCGSKLAREIASCCELDPMCTLRLIQQLRSGAVIIMRLTTTRELFSKLQRDRRDIFDDPHIFYHPQLNRICNHMGM